MESNESLPENQDPPILTGKARALKRAESWKEKQNARTMSEIEATRKYRLFPGLSDEEIDNVMRLYAEIKDRELAEQEELRRSQEELIEPTVADLDEYQQIDLPTNTIPLESTVEEVHSVMKTRIGPEIQELCPLESLYRFSSCQLLHFVAPNQYKNLSQIVHTFQNFDIILRCVQLNAPFISDEFSIFPQHDDFLLRSSTLKSFDFFRKFVDVYPDSCTAVAVDNCRLLFSYSKPFGAMMPLDYTLESLALDARRVQCLLTYVQASDSELLQPRRLVDSLLPSAPYLAFINQLPVENLCHKVVRKTSRFPNNPGKLIPASQVRCYFDGTGIDLLTLSEAHARRMSTKSWLRNSLPSIRYARRHSAYEDEVNERNFPFPGDEVDW